MTIYQERKEAPVYTNSKYINNKQKLKNLLASGFLLRECSAKLGYSMATIHKWKHWILKEEGSLRTDEREEMKGEFLMKSRTRIENAVYELLKIIDTTTKEGTRINAIAKLAQLVSTEKDLLIAAGILKNTGVESEIELSENNMIHKLREKIITEEGAQRKKKSVEKDKKDGNKKVIVSTEDDVDVF